MIHLHVTILVPFLLHRHGAYTFQFCKWNKIFKIKNLWSNVLMNLWTCFFTHFKKQTSDELFFNFLHLNRILLMGPQIGNIKTLYVLFYTWVLCLYGKWSYLLTFKTNRGHLKSKEQLRNSDHYQVTLQLT